MDSFNTEIDKAIGAHGMWKMRLRAAIQNQASEYDPVIVAKDDHCEFGRWLHAHPTLKKHANFRNIQKVHAQFHIEASKVLELALAGNVGDALGAMDDDAPFGKVSLLLVKLLLCSKKEES